MSKKQAWAGIVAVLAFWGLMIFARGGLEAVIVYGVAIGSGASVFLLLFCLMQLGRP